VWPLSAGAVGSRCATRRDATVAPWRLAATRYASRGPPSPITGRDTGHVDINVDLVLVITAQISFVLFVHARRGFPVVWTMTLAGMSSGLRRRTSANVHNEDFANAAIRSTMTSFSTSHQFTSAHFPPTGLISRTRTLSRFYFVHRFSC